MSKLLEANGSSQKSLFDAEGKAVPISNSLLEEMNALVLEAQSSNEQSQTVD